MGNGAGGAAVRRKQLPLVAAGAAVAFATGMPLTLRTRILLAPPRDWENRTELIVRLKLRGRLSSVSRALGELVALGVLESQPTGVGNARQYRLSRQQLLVSVEGADQGGPAV